MTFKALRLAIPVLLKRIGCDSRHDIDVNLFSSNLSAYSLIYIYWIFIFSFYFFKKDKTFA